MAYSLSTHFAGQGLLDSFNFFTGEDPNNGFVDYQGREEALAQKIVSIDEFNRVKLGVDSINTYSTTDKGRPSVRITSNDHYTHGLFIADFAHMPGSACGTWPAFWAFNNEDNGALWPIGGEIDIIEGANTAQRNLMSAHTTPGCQAPSTGFTGAQGPTDCSSSSDNIGCNYAAPTSDPATYGDAFNAEGGGVYALEWDREVIKIWHFPRSAIPEDISLAPIIKPDPATWGPPQALFGGSGCEADTYFFNMSLVINTNFCGAYAGNIWGVADQCSKLAPTCEEYVAKNPGSFNSAFWQINYIDIYQKPALTNGTIPSTFPNSTTISRPPVSSATSLPSFSNDTVIPSGTRTVTISTITQAISTSEPTRTGGGLADPATINGWTLLGCFGSLAGYHSFSKVASFVTMDNEACVASCAGHKYAGVSSEVCYCADILGDASAVANDMCDVPCPGNPHEFCGGVLDASERNTSPSFAGMGIAQTNATLAGNSTSRSSRLRLNPVRPRAAPPDILLTVYGDIDDAAVPPGAPGMGGGSKGETVAVTSAVTVTFTTICPTDAARLITLEYRTTLTAAPAPANRLVLTAPAVPMTTCTETCSACGPHGESTVTLTVPEAVAAGTGGGEVLAVAVQTVVPVVAPHNVTTANASFAAPSVSATVPAAGSAAKKTAGFFTTMGYGVAVWFLVFGVAVVL
ncbi:glycoside hydrolase family 16 protein [Xylariaceae sp. FL1651]|nr:glycoside hydrolase family 16 protein [Xylariaceae sp. FL1651]